MRTPLLVELRRGAARPAALAMLVLGTLMFPGTAEFWSGTWPSFTAYVRGTVLAVCSAVMVAAGAWQAGRERRRGLDELLSSVPRPSWQPLVVAWAAVASSGTVGLLAALVVPAVLVHRVATYATAGAWTTVAAGLLWLWTSAAIGVLAGRWIPGWVVAPLAGLIAYVLLLFVPLFRTSWFLPGSADLPVGSAVPPVLAVLQGSWFVALAGTLVALAGRWLRGTVVSGGAALAAAVPLAVVPWADRVADPGAVVPVCTGSGPRVCVARVHAFLLDDLAATVQPILRRMDGVPGLPRRSADDALRSPNVAERPTVDGDTVWLLLSSSVDGQLADPEQLRESFAEAVSRCPDEQAHDEGTYDLAVAWLLGREPGPAVPVDRLRALPATRQRDWFAEYQAAAHDCDAGRMAELRTRLPD